MKQRRLSPRVIVLGAQTAAPPEAASDKAAKRKEKAQG